MGAYFQDYSEQHQQEIWEAVTEIVKEREPDYKEQAKDCGMSADDWLRETVDHYINVNNRSDEWAGYIK